jgi:hypothetical protein
MQILHHTVGMSIAPCCGYEVGGGVASKRKCILLCGAEGVEYSIQNCTMQQTGGGGGKGGIPIRTAPFCW